MNCPVHNTPMRLGGAVSPIPGECLYYCSECYKAVKESIDPSGSRGEFGFYWAGPMPFTCTSADPKWPEGDREAVK